MSKFDLLTLIAKIYGKQIHILEDSDVVANRSLKSQQFSREMGFILKFWDRLIQEIKNYRDKRSRS
ncbi:NAD dependent epimerase/dehydratase family protein [Leptospira kirschneri serovar Sokoine str. RM1]|nr:NAD dependent epimerase/dehydratase family protein [Leptospira kirschneri serovar Sokoine str. RM1]